jgi:hypothetical protein
MGVVVGASVFANVRAAAAVLVPVIVCIVIFFLLKKSLIWEGLLVSPLDESSSMSAA